ncbi:hypothetical protein [Oleiphilus messinensis]|nr:hypothetical protein [Oleiphilus messinensis]
MLLKVAAASAMSLKLNLRTAFGILAGLLISAPALAQEAGSVHMAEETLNIADNSYGSFSGVYRVGYDQVHFSSAAMDSRYVRLTVDVNGMIREAIFDLNAISGQVVAGHDQMSAEELELMQDAAVTVASFLSKQSAHEFNDHLVVLLGAMNDWSSF